MNTQINYKGLEIFVTHSNDDDDNTEQIVQTINRGLLKHSSKVQNAKMVNDALKIREPLEYISFLSNRGLL
jgi:hypothetical protein